MSTVMVLMVPGCDFENDGKPGPETLARLKAAAAAWKTGEYDWVVTSDGSWHAGNNGAAVMANWLAMNGVPPDKIRCETESADTYENLQLSRAKLGIAGAKWVIPTEPSQYARFAKTARAMNLAVGNIPVPVKMSIPRSFLEGVFLALHTVDPLGNAKWNPSRINRRRRKQQWAKEKNK